MKKILLFILILGIGFNTLAQQVYKFKPGTKEHKRIEAPAIGIEPLKSPAITKSVVKPEIPSPPNRDVNIVNIIDIGTSANAYGYGYNGGQKSLVWADPDLNIVTNFHRMGGALDPDGYSGDLGYDISFDGGATWTNMVECYIATDNAGGEYYTDAARYPNHGIFNPTNNIDDAFVAFFAPTLDASNGDAWGGYSFGVSDISDPTVTTKNLRSSAGDYYQYLPEGYELTTLGEVWVVDINEDWTSGSMVYQENLIVNRGVWNGSDFEYTPSLLDFPTTDQEKPVFVQITFSEDGITGYIVALSNNGTADQIGGRSNLYPIYWKTTDGGDNWSGPFFIQLDGPNGLDRIVNNHLSDADINNLFSAPVPSRDEISYATAFDMNCAVDNFGNLHIAVVIGPTGTDSYAIVTQYLAAYDIFTSDGGYSWYAEEMGRIATFRGTFGDLTEDNRIQITTNKSGNRVFVSWLDTDLVDHTDNDYPNIWCRGFDPTTNMKTVDNDGLDAPYNVTLFSAGMWQSYFFAAPKWCFENEGTYNIPFTYEDMDPADAAAPVQFKYISDFTFSDADFTIPGDNEYEMEHFTTVWTGNPYQPMTVIVNSAQFAGSDMQVGDEIGIFDDDGSGNLICVGVGNLTGPIIAGSPLSIVVSANDPTTTEADGFTNGNTMIYKLWDSHNHMEFSNVTAVYNPGFAQVFTTLGTAIVELTGFAHFQTVWSGNPYQPMNILLSTATIDGDDLNIGDEVGIFDVDDTGNEICVGVVIVSETITSANPQNVVVSSDDPSTTEIDGFTTGNTIIFRAWASSTQTEYLTYQADYNAALDDVFTPLGTALVDLAFLSFVTQSIDLSLGWNIMSFYVSPDDMNMLNIVQPLVNSNELTKIINEAGGFIQYIPGVGWMNTIGDMANTEGYYFKVTNNTVLEVNGMAVASPYEIPLNSGWNIMSYPFDQSQDALVALESLINANELIKVIDEAGGFIQFIPGVGWMNTIGNFDPDEGYYIKVNANTSLTFNISSNLALSPNTMNLKKPQFFDKSFDNNPYYPMNIIITKIELYGYFVEEGDEIAVFDDDICVGVGIVGENIHMPINIVVSQDDPFTAEIDGYLEGNKLSLKYMSSEQNNPIDVFVEKIDGIDVFQPLETYVCSLSSSPNGSSDLSFSNDSYNLYVFPNPAKNSINIQLDNNIDGHIKIEISDLFGKTINVLSDEMRFRGNYNFKYDISKLSNGIYSIKLTHKTLNNISVSNYKLIVSN